MNKNDRNYLVEKIRTQYTEREHTEIYELRKLDKRVKKPALVFAYSFGSFSALIMGCGMSLVMTDLGDTLGLHSPMLPGIVIGVVGMLMAVSCYPIYKRILNNRRKKYAEEIIALSDKLLKERV